MNKLFKLFEREATLFSVVVFWLSLAFISFLFLTDDSEDDDLFAEKFGTVSYSKASVRRKKSSKFSWFSIGPNSVVAVNDSIKTGPDSAAIIEMKNGGSLEVGENSLVILKDTDSISNDFIRGSLIIRDSKGDRKINVDESGKRTEEKLSYRWIEPVLQQEYVTPPQRPLKLGFKWLEGANAKKAELRDIVFEVSTRENFLESLTTSVKLDKLERSYTQELLPGKYFYRLRSVEGEPFTETRVVKITELSPLNVSPLEITTFGTKANVQLTWTLPKAVQSLYSSGQHSLEVSNSTKFETILMTQEISPLSGKTSILDLPLGQYYVRIKSSIRSLELFGANASLRLTKTKKMQIEALTPLRSAIADMSQPIEFQWTAEPITADQITYLLELRDEGTQVLSQKLTQSRYVWTASKEGKINYSISAYLGDEKIAQSKEIEFSVGLPRNIIIASPRNGQDFVSWPDKGGIKFQWSSKTKKNFESYNLDFSKTEDFEKLEASQKLRVPEFILSYDNVKEGRYYWRVMATADDGSREQSKVYSFNYEYPELLPATNIRNLKKEYNLSKEKLPVVKWKDIKNAQGFELEILKQNDGGRSPASVLSQKTKDTEYLIPSLKEGAYVVNVWAIDPAGRRGNPFKQNFVVKYGELLKAPKLKRVEVE